MSRRIALRIKRKDGALVDTLTGEILIPAFTGDASQVLQGDKTFGTGGASSAWPIGSVFIAAVGTDPATLLGFGTWTPFAAGRVLVGLDATQTEFDVVLETGGEKTHTLTANEVP